MENYQLAFIPAENYITKIQLPFGTGVVACYSEEDAMRLTGRRKNFLTKNEWYDIEIPSRNTFLNLDSPIMENSVRAISSLFSDKALAMLFIQRDKNSLMRKFLYTLKIGKYQNKKKKKLSGKNWIVSINQKLKK